MDLKTTVTKLGLAGLIGLGPFSGCLATPLDPDATEAFVCDAETACPPTQSCLQGRCVLGELPQISVLSPEEDALLSFDPEQGEVRMVVIRIGGDHLDLVDPATDPEAAVGAGQIRVRVDGVEVESITSGDISGGVLVEVPMSNRAGQVYLI